ncbi:MAG: hypothetical protein KVP17_003351 [Porospora cf. gigantea B]|uniref:uncharacterized protein n=1 Tax=Porospora cf. gigantea B TaxID=2853592 RepID=UPI003571EB51|nr:MAG: hypothetical protein KVP17_003351 [Porospora cf. gigantea B]
MLCRSLPLIIAVTAIRVHVNVPEDPADLEVFGKPIYSGVCDPRISLVHAQDSTATFESLIADLEKDHVIEDLVADLKSTYGAAEYGMATFGDKPAPLHGYGRDWSVWQPGFDTSTWSSDECYTAHLSLQTLTDSTPIWDAVKISGGKDFEENQFDAMGKAAIDPFFWEHAFKSQKHARIVMMITDDFAHHSGSGTLDIGDWGFDSTYRGTQRYYNRDFGSYSEDKSNFRIVDDMGSAHLLWPLGAGGSEVLIQGNDAYRSFIICNDSAGMNDTKFRKDLLKRLNTSGVDIGTTNVNNTDQTKAWWEQFCAREYDAFTKWHFGGLFEWANNYKYIEDSAIQNYPYTNIDFNADLCTSYEYPDVSATQFGDMFKRSGVIPTVILTPQLPKSAYE